MMDTAYLARWLNLQPIACISHHSALQDPKCLSYDYHPSFTARLETLISIF